MQLTGIHHLTAITANAGGNHAFYTQTLGMRLVKKTVNQDDTSAYHLFYADGQGSPGTDITFFDWPTPRERRGTHSIVRTGLRVPNAQSLAYWKDRLQQQGVKHGDVIDRDGRQILELEDAEGQRITLVPDDGRWQPKTWDKSPVPAEHQILGLGPITISVPNLKPTESVLTQIMNMRNVRQYQAPASNGSGGSNTVHVFEMGEGGPSAELHVAVEPNVPVASQGAGGVHHVAFRVPTYEAYDEWYARLRKLGMPSSGPVDRFYFKSLYFREPNGILFELATDGPGFDADEPRETMGQKLSLPPFLESYRSQIEAGLKPL